MWETIRRWFKQVNCEHRNRVLVGIGREPMTYTRQGSYHCPDCDREWTSWRLPDSVAR
jgi:hypothetical protein